jgi:hypothetical protein
MRNRVRCNCLPVAAVLLLPALACADDEHIHDHQKMEMGTVSPNDPPIKVTINPEARVSVTLAGALPPAAPCEAGINLAVKIVNQGFVTASLEAVLVGDPPAGVTLDFHPEPLRGVPEEVRKLYITLTRRGPTDLTIAFRAHNEIPDLGGRDRIHLLLRCHCGYDGQVHETGLPISVVPTE